ncbi:hypothetical protein [Tunturiibacter gelidiferens]|uniref:hypothetical protein n=1 Tax=Tunturiibacter gelidiferens TaxID=3069689 RepID=UPI003D9AED15
MGLNSFRDYPNNTTHAVIGTVTYPEDPGHPGHILYIKSSLTGDEPADMLNFRNQHPTFPNETTLNQFFTESEFESYRRLGQHIIQDDEIVGAGSICIFRRGNVLNCRHGHFDGECLKPAVRLPKPNCAVSDEAEQVRQAGFSPICPHIEMYLLDWPSLYRS